MASKTVSSREEAEARKEKAADFMRRIGNDDGADDFDAMSVDEYIEHAGLKLGNPNRRRCLNRANDKTKADLQNAINEVSDLLDTADAPESSREDLVSAISNALDVLDDVAEEEPEDENEDLENGDGDDDSD